MAIAIFTLPADGEALLTDRQVAAALSWSVSKVWSKSRDDVDFPRPVRDGERCTRWRLSEVREYIACMEVGTARTTPLSRTRQTTGAQDVTTSK